MPGLYWNAIANLIGVSPRTLHRHRQNASVGQVLSFTDISDDEVCRQLLTFKEDFPDIGQKIAMGLFRSKGIIIPRSKLWKAFHKVDPINTLLRRHARIKRRVYSVPGPLSLWHIG